MISCQLDDFLLPWNASLLTQVPPSVWDMLVRDTRCILHGKGSLLDNREGENEQETLRCDGLILSGDRGRGSLSLAFILGVWSFPNPPVDGWKSSMDNGRQVASEAFTSAEESVFRLYIDGFFEPSLKPSILSVLNVHIIKLSNITTTMRSQSQGRSLSTEDVTVARPQVPYSLYTTVPKHHLLSNYDLLVYLTIFFTCRPTVSVLCIQKVRTINHGPCTIYSVLE